jgi:ribosomal protein S18 acetylase RimI-like enzyme
VSEPVLRRYRPADHDAVVALLLAAYDDHVKVEYQYIEVLSDVAGRDRDAEVWVAMDGDDLLGTVTICPPGSPYREVARDDEGEFRMLAVDPRARGRGVGRLLTAAAVDEARKRGQAAVVLSTTATMTAAHRLYESMGFGRVPDRDWSPNQYVDLLVYRLEL